MNRYVVMVALVAMLFGFGNQVLTPSFPSIAQAFQISPSEVSLIISAYSLPGIFVSPLYGVLSDRFGRRRVLLPMILVFGITGVAAGFTTDFTILLIARFIQGISGAAFFPLAFIIVGDLFTGHERNLAMSNTMLVVMAAGTIHPFLGGILTLFSWRYVFFGFIVAIPIFLAASRVLPETSPFIKKEENNDSETKTVAQTQKDDPLSTNVPSFSTAWAAVLGVIILGILFFFIIFGTFTLFTSYYVEQGLGWTPFETGIIQSLTSVVSVLLLTKFGSLTERYSKPVLIFISYLALGVACFSFALPPYVLWLIVTSLSVGIGRAIAFTTLSAYILDLSSPLTRGKAIATYESSLKIGQTYGPYLFALLYLGAGEVLAAPFIAGTVFSGIGCILCLPLIRYTSKTGLGKPTHKDTT
jgi:MFS family permease